MGRKNKRHSRQMEDEKPPNLETAKTKTPCLNAESVKNSSECPAAKDEALNAFLQSVIGEDGGRALLVKFALNGNAKSLDQLLTAGADVNARCDENINSEEKYRDAPVLCCAVWEGHPECVKILLQHGADVNLTDSDNKSALHVAAQENKVECLKLLIESVDDVDNVSDDNTPLMQAVEYGSIDCLQILLRAGADVNNEKNKTGLHWAVLHRKSIECLKELIKEGANVNQVDEDGDTALHVVSDKGAPDFINELIAGGADVNARGEYMETPVMKAAKENNPKCVTALIEAGADVNAVTEEGMTALMYAARAKSPRCVEVLIKAGADLNIVDKSKQTAFLYAGQNLIDNKASKHYTGKRVNKDAERCLTLLTLNTEVDVNDADNRSLLMEAVKNNDKLTWDVLYEAGADVDLKVDGYSLASHVVKLNNGSAFEMLIEDEANLAQQDDDGESALSLACRSESLDICKAAVVWAIKSDHVKSLKGAEVNLKFYSLSEILLTAKDNEVDTDMLVEVLRESKHSHAEEMISLIYACYCLAAFHVDVFSTNAIQTVALKLAAECGDEQSIGPLIKAGANVDGDIQLFPTPVTLAAKHDNLSALKVLVKKGADVNQVGKKGRTALHYAAKYDNRACVRVLLDAGADDNIQDKRGRTAGNIAVKGKAQDCIKLLRKVDLDSSSSSSDSSCSSNSSASSWSSLDSTSWF